MKSPILATVALAAIGAACATPVLAQQAPQAAATAQAPLRIIQFDFEGAGGTLFITPNKKALLIDTAWPASFSERLGEKETDAQRIADTLKKEGISKVDYLLTTHYHVDHIGGFAEFVKLMPVDTFLDHGPNREELPANANPRQVASAPATLYPQYVAAIGSGKRIIVKPGQKFTLDGITITAVDSDGQVLASPLAGAGEPGIGCDTTKDMEANGGEENPRSLGVVIDYGKARILALGDTTRNIENKLMCPVDLIGPIDFMLATHHGFAFSNGRVVPATLKPTVVVIPNGATKGGDPSTYDAFASVDAVEGLWQVHEAVKPDSKNVPSAYIANIAGEPDANHPILIDVSNDGTVAVTNTRTGYQRVYPPKH